MNANLPFFRVTTQSEQIDRLLFQERLVARLSAFFGLLALVLASIGLYGLLSYEVARRTREIGIRMALGAEGTDVLRMVLRQGFVLAFIGAAAGVATALAVTPLSLIDAFRRTSQRSRHNRGVAVLLGLVALAACYIPRSPRHPRRPPSSPCATNSAWDSQPGLSSPLTQDSKSRTGLRNPAFPLLETFPIPLRN